MAVCSLTSITSKSPFSLVTSKAFSACGKALNVASMILLFTCCSSWRMVASHSLSICTASRTFSSDSKIPCPSVSGSSASASCFLVAAALATLTGIIGLVGLACSTGSSGIIGCGSVTTSAMTGVCCFGFCFPILSMMSKSTLAAMATQPPPIPLQRREERRSGNGEGSPLLGEGLGVRLFMKSAGSCGSWEYLRRRASRRSVSLGVFTVV